MINNIKQSRLRIEYERMIDGEREIEGKNYNNIRPEATDEAVFEAAQLISSLQAYPLHEIERRNDKSLMKLGE